MYTAQNGSPTTTSDHDRDEGGYMDFSTFMDGTAEDVKGYMKAQKEYLALHVTEKASSLMGKAVQSVVVLAIATMVLLFLNLALALYVGDLLHSRPLGFVIVAGTYLVLLGIFQLWWSNGGRDRFVLDRINDLNDNAE